MNFQETTNIFMVIIIILLATAIVIVIFNPNIRILKREVEGDYRRQAILTDNEKEFYGRLLMGLGDFHVFPQMSMAAIVTPTSKDPKQYMSHFRAVSQKRIDFVVCKKDIHLDVVCVIELDDRTHVKEKDEARDALLGSAGIKTIRYESKRKPDARQIAADVKYILKR